MGLCNRLDWIRLLAVMAGGALLEQAAVADVTVLKDADGKPRLSIGGDTSIRFEHYTNETYFRNMNLPSSYDGPETEFYRQQTRLWGTLQLAPDVSLFTRFAQRWQYFWSRPGENNASSATWEWPDEIIIDNLYLNADKIGGTNWSVRAGRMDLVEKDASGREVPMFGNGMMLFEGTPRDGSRTIYFDGAVASYKGENDTLRLFGFYNQYKDRFLVISDQNRRLSAADTGVAGAYWTHRFAKEFNTDLYLFGVNADDDVYEQQNMQMAVPGFRVFGAPHALVDYSVEYARQFGEYQAGVTDGDRLDAYGSLLDARLNVKTPEGTFLQPVFQFEYTWFSGDDPGTTESYEGWCPTFAQYPIWREELMPTMTSGGNWTNLHQFRLGVPLSVVPKKVTVSPFYAYLLADHPGRTMAGGGGANADGSEIGHMVGGFIDYKITPWWSTSFIVSALFPGDYFDGAAGGVQDWIRLETRLWF